MELSEQDISSALADKFIVYLAERRDSKEEAFLKSKIKRNKQGKVTNGAIVERVIIQLEKVLPEDKVKTLKAEIKKIKKSKEQTALEFQRKKLEDLLKWSGEVLTDPLLINLKQELFEFVIKNSKDHEPVEWLNNWAQKAKDISFATHVGKLTHSSSKSSSIFDTTTDIDNRYLSTNTLKSLAIDTASSNAASLPVADVLNLSVADVSLLDRIKEGDGSFFRLFTENQSLIENWLIQFKQAFDSSSKKSYFLSKQVYFPIAHDEYHLLLPLTSSSLAHELHLEHKKRWDEPYKKAFEQKGSKKYSDQVVATYPNKASLHVTGSNHSNASSLNGKRGGRISLMAALPPQWNAKLPSYAEHQSIFTRSLSYELWDEISELSSYLLLLKNKELSVSAPKRNAAVLAKLSAINDQFFNFIESINNSESQVGWTLTSKLDIEYQVLFEPWRDDDAALGLKKNNDWLNKISQDFGRWLNQQLNKNKQLKLTPIQAALWSDCFFLDLKEFFAIKEVEL
ncbi:type I-F CRISPR-associated protein Csy1 [Vibrio cholerae]|uniref:type I-F CRISPR-associated protein Csy1 n=1 Tax=Vibrio TaxID=662 RepID=UPI0013C345D6|nr:MULTISPECIES: type I-F CRISPR-associated protein Csy1 [Vibrio]MCX9580265.1 type I-F CRISPR-associated protein Csy1 [Vibrio cholerae]MCX9584059.1 type I-F CRISPR-associated protein Csy1 [Vibrio cholerae]GHW44726.1 type I-F CRISPR-associated protein Csy1 [Vibrio cholerae]GHZ84549.1 type I-F CRISPR-associated protein Csy1 [Vibrio cholerae]HDL8936088.1 type I-F CRISPR-associated protein Csy1 [Vibrio cholerae]